jgi:hypothetical protein
VLQQRLHGQRAQRTEGLRIAPALLCLGLCLALALALVLVLVRAVAVAVDEVQHDWAEDSWGGWQVE